MKFDSPVIWRMCLLATTAICAVHMAGSARGTGVPIDGFLPMVGFGLTDEFQTLEQDLLFSFADPSDEPGGTSLGAGDSPHFDLALLDTGANGSLLTHETDEAFDIQGAGFRGTNVVSVGGATGTMDALVNDPLGIYATGVQHRTQADPLAIDPSAMVGQTSVSLLKLEPDSDLPNVLGLPFASQYATQIRNDQPQLFQLNGRTVRTPQIDFLPIGSGGQGIERRAPLILSPGASFVSPPAYLFDFMAIAEGQPAYDNPTSHTLHSDGTVSAGGMFLNVDVANQGEDIEESKFFFDTGASVTVVSELNAARLGFDPVLDDPEFTVEVIGSGGTASGVPGFFVDELNVATVGGDFTATDVPVIVLNVADASDPANIVDGIVGMNVFSGRNLVIDPQPSLGGGGIGPQLYISDPVTTDVDWSTEAPTGAWSDGSNWTSTAPPDLLSIANVRQVAGVNQTATISSDAEAGEVNISGSSESSMTLDIQNGARLTTFSSINIESGGALHISSGTIDTQFMDIREGVLSGQGHITTGSGPITGQVENTSGTLAIGDANGGMGMISIEGRLSNGAEGKLEFDVGGLLGGVHHDQLHVDGQLGLAGTLDVEMVELDDIDYELAEGHAFTLMTASEGMGGQFDQLFLPAGVVWDLEYASNELVLTALSTLAGDFNADGIVNAADYVVWRNAEGSTASTRADADGSGLVDGADLDIWRANFGQVAAGALGGLANVPEPASSLLAIATLLAALTGWRSKRPT